ncbi:MAG: hypothetical protein GY953_30545, partial [bacterium]|nr:hypothetical protein [bacterium]
MSKYDQKPLELSGLSTIPIRERGGKVRVEHFARPHARGAGLTGWLESLPKILAAEDFHAVVAALHRARENGRAIIWG